VVQPGLTVGQRLAYLLGPPGYSHDGSRLTTADLKHRWVHRHPEHSGEPGLPELAGEQVAR
jgi:hypothetical protein